MQAYLKARPVVLRASRRGGRCRTGIDGHNSPATEHVESSSTHENGRVLVDAHTEVRGLPQHGSEQTREPPPLAEVHVDNDPG